MTQVQDKVCEITAKILGLDLNQVSLDASFQEDLGADSIDVVEVVIAVEDEFGIDISDERAERVRSVQDIIDCVNEIKEINDEPA
ncbi:acyl carrier protein [Candidatus Comchoanobacter bicostacola]|uniref:Acyl carrier protein n=1 Tax=Candidatus Comchoanobacter bicostacola TaxID=2919598 RepID=A0ABY5DHD0_9GAMM|nr:acyl carrier protein [Candidatus Comchoanobacter bicostacola]UTC24150.1 acyl carrier protein [Candidatus Comchoanobacter bicostacola]